MNTTEFNTAATHLLKLLTAEWERSQEDGPGAGTDVLENLIAKHYPNVDESTKQRLLDAVSDDFMGF